MRQLFLVLYAISGAAGLLYQVTWSRLLTLHMGHTVAAVGTVLAAFMGGLAVGAAVAGRLSVTLSRERALRAYAWLELLVGASALLLPLALEGLQPLLARAYADGNGGASFGMVRLVTSLALITVPAAAMGATFPVAVRWFVGSADQAGAHAGGLYAVNTVGAAIGAAGSGFVLLPVLGISRTTWVGIALNLAAAAGAFWMAGRAAATAEAPGSPAPAAVPPSRSAGRGSRPKRRDHRASSPEDGQGQPWLAGTVLAISGFVALTYEVTWTRILALVIGPTTYAFSAMLTAFIGGIAGGSALGARLIARGRRPVLALGVTLLLSALGALVITRVIQALPLTIARAVADPSAGFTSVMLLQSALVTGLLLPMTVGFGAAFPLGVAVAARRLDRVSSDVAIVYVLNTVGAVSGALAASFVLVPWLGLLDTVRLASALAIVSGTMLIVMAHAARRSRWAGLAVAAVATWAVLAPPTWNQELMSSGAYKYAPYVRGTDLESGLEAGTLLYYDEGSAGTVSVRRVAGAVSLAIDGKVDASNAGDMLTQKLLAHLPLLLHPDPREVAIIGLGSGVTLGAALAHPVERVDMLELSPEVVEASNFFAAENRDALDDPRTNLILGDGRTHLLLASRTYDVIISEPSNPWMAGVATLFTREFFEAARDRLGDDGILCQWAHTYDISDEDLRSITATFQSVFPDGSLWQVGEGDVLLIGMRQPLERSLAQIADAWARPGVAGDLKEVEARDLQSVLSLFVAAGPDLARYAADAPIQTDDHTPLEFSAPRGIYGQRVNENTQALRDLGEEATQPATVGHALESPTAVEWRNRGLMQLGAEAFELAYDHLARALQADPTDTETLEAFFKAAGGAGRAQAATALLDDLATRHPRNVVVRIELSRILAARGDYDRAVEVASAAANVQQSARTLEQLASVLADLGDAQRLEPVVETMRRSYPDDSGTRYFTAALRFLREDFAGAAALGEQIVAADPTSGRAQNLLGAAYATLGQIDAARTAFQAAVRADPRDPATYVNLGVFELRAANPSSAGEHFAEALAIDPESPAALNGLADALEAQGQLERAVGVRRLAASPS